MNENKDVIFFTSKFMDLYAKDPRLRGFYMCQFLYCKTKLKYTGYPNCRGCIRSRKTQC